MQTCRGSIHGGKEIAIIGCDEGRDTRRNKNANVNVLYYVLVVRVDLRDEVEEGGASSMDGYCQCAIRKAELFDSRRLLGGKGSIQAIQCLEQAQVVFMRVICLNFIK